ncbi:MAG: DNA replication/repair protein RecF [Fibrobacter sp.]|nr:DNA replication/repair protein RecF [Fibrobacter sp.]
MISSLFIQNVRSFEQFEREFVPGINVVGGPNGCGKTSVLESIHLLSQGFSFRAKELAELIRWNTPELIMRGEFESLGKSWNRGVCIGKRKSQARENGEDLRSVAGFFGKCPSVIMQPSDIELLRGAPEVRRRWLDEILCFRSAANVATLRQYKRVLQQRNQWLRQFKQEGAAVGGDDLFHVLTDQLVELGARLWAARVSLSSDISPVITGYYRKLSGGVDEITCAYRSSIFKSLDVVDEMSDAADGSAEASMVGLDEAQFREAFGRKLSEMEKVEKTLGMTMAGPHRDDLDLCISGYAMRSAGSQGQCRSAALSMRFAAVDIASENLGKPILLLDDIFAELDLSRRDAVASLIREKQCQVVIATPEPAELPFQADSLMMIAKT